MNNSLTTSRWNWLAGIGLVVLTVLGWLNSPIDRASGRPLLLVPEVKAVHDYQANARVWLNRFQSLDAEIAGLLVEPTGDLFSRSSQANQTVENAVSLTQRIDRTQAPLSLTSLQGAFKQAGLTYLEAARSALIWVSTPSAEKLADAQAKLQTARQQVEQLKQSEWLIP